MKSIRKFFSGLRNTLKAFGAVALMGMTLLTCADVVGRYLGHPIFGSVEIVGFLATLAVALALPHTHEFKGHIGVEILVRVFSEKTQSIIELITNTVSFLLFVIVSWRMILYAGTMKRSGEVSMNLEFPEYYIIYITAFCFIIFSLTILEEIITIFAKLTGDK